MFIKLPDGMLINLDHITNISHQDCTIHFYLPGLQDGVFVYEFKNKDLAYFAMDDIQTGLSFNSGFVELTDTEPKKVEEEK